MAVVHLRHVTERLLRCPSLQSRAEKLFERVCEAGDYVSRLVRYALAFMQDSLLLRKCGLMSPEEFHDELDTGAFIGFTNGVYDTERDILMPTGEVGHNVLVSMSTKYAYVSLDIEHFGGAPRSHDRTVSARNGRARPGSPQPIRGPGPSPSHSAHRRPSRKAQRLVRWQLTRAAM